MTYTDVQFQLPLSCLEESYNYTILDNTLFGTWIPDLEEYCSDWLVWERESDIVDGGSEEDMYNRMEAEAEERYFEFLESLEDES